MFSQGARLRTIVFAVLEPGFQASAIDFHEKRHERSESQVWLKALNAAVDPTRRSAEDPGDATSVFTDYLWV